MAPFTRRGFGRTILAGAGAAGLGRLLQAQNDCAPPAGTPVDFVIPKLQNIVRKSVAELTASEVTRLRLAYQKLRDSHGFRPYRSAWLDATGACALLDVRRKWRRYSWFVDVSAVASRLPLFP